MEPISSKSKYQNGSPYTRNNIDKRTAQTIQHNTQSTVEGVGSYNNQPSVTQGETFSSTINNISESNRNNSVTPIKTKSYINNQSSFEKTPTQVLALKKVISEYNPNKNNDLRSVYQGYNHNIINNTKSQEYHKVPKFQTIKQTHYYQNLSQVKTNINQSNQSIAYINQTITSSFQPIHSPFKPNQNLSQLNNNTNQQTEFSAIKNPTYSLSHYNQIDLERKNLNSSNQMNNTQGKFSTASKKSDASKSLLMDLFNIKKVSEQATDDAHVQTKSNYRLRNLQTASKMRDSMGKFFVKRKAKGPVQNDQTIQQEEDVSPMKNGRSFTTIGCIGNRKKSIIQQQKTIFETLGINNQYYMVDQSMKKQNASQDYSKKSKSKSMQKYYKREKEFEKVYQEKLSEFRQNETLVKVSEHINKMKPVDISLYKERDDPYKILSNRIKTRAQMTERKYLHKNLKILEKFFDPLRVRLRVMPQSRAPLVQGKNSDFYFVEGAKLCLKNNLPEALETIKKGLELKPTHFLCRFNHGVVLFKLGLIAEAINDFEMVTRLNSKEPSANYNLAICYVQIGKYKEAVDECLKAIQTCQDNELLYDIYKLKGICSYRLELPLVAIKDFTQAHKCEQQLQKKQNDQLLQDPEFVYINLFIEETKHLMNDQTFQKTLMNVSKSESSLLSTVFDMQQFKRFNSQSNLEVQTQKDLSPKKLKQTKQEVIKEEEGDQSDNIQYKSFDFTSISKKNTKFIQNNYAKGNKSPSPNRKLTSDIRDISPINRGKFTKQSTLTKESQMELEYLKTFVGMSPNKKYQDNLKKSLDLEAFYYNQMKQQVDNAANHGTNLRYDKIYDISPTRQLSDLTKEEKFEIDKRQKLENELSDNKQAFKPLTIMQEDRFIKFLLGVNEVKMREVNGTQSEYGMKQVASQQIRLEHMMEQLKHTFIEKTAKWDQEFDYQDNKNDVNNPPTNDNLSNQSQKDFFGLRPKETVLDKLNQSLLQNEITPDDVSNILVRDLEDQDRQKQQAKFKNLKALKRLTLGQVETIKQELNVPEDGERNLANLDKLMKNLKFFKRFDQDIRHKIYINVELISLPSQTVIFDQGDVGDKLYIILKGRVAVQVNSPDYGNLPVVVATLNDGEQFGELSLISLNKIQDGNKMTEALSESIKTQQQFARRKATCITVEQTELLALSKDISVQLYQPSAVAKKSISRGKSLVVSKKSLQESSKQLDGASKEDQDELNQKIQFLQSLSIFEDIDAQLLMPIACNMVAKTYNFGDQIVKEGEIPKGLYIIKSGQCKVASLREVKPLSRGFQNDRIFVSEDGQEIKDKIVYQDVLAFAQLMPKCFFGGRVLLPFEMYANLRRIYYGQESLSRYYPKGVSPQVVDSEPEEKHQLKSLLSIIADSGTVELYILDKNDMGYIPDFILRKVFEKIALLKEPDRPFHQSKVEEMKETMVKWAQYKVDCVDKMLKEKYAEKYKGKIK